MDVKLRTMEGRGGWKKKGVQAVISEIVLCLALLFDLSLEIGMQSEGVLLVQ